jgi:hypothetical protein
MYWVLGVWRSFYYCWSSRFVFPIVCLLKYSHIECHLAAKSGTECGLIGLLRYELYWLEMMLLPLLFSVICYYHQIVMISVIKLRWVAGLVDLHGVNVIAFIPLFKFSLKVTMLAWSSFYLRCFNFLGIDGYCSSCVELFLYNFLGIGLFSELSMRFERHLAAEFGTFFVLFIW